MSKWQHEFKISATMPTDQVLEHLKQAIINYINGDWQVISARRLLPSFRLQKYGAIELMGRDIKISGDMYYVTVFYEVRKRPG